jgi:hypothetical protein
MKTAAASATLCAVLFLAGAASASTDRYFSYDADNDAAKHRTQEIHIWLRQGLMGGVRLVHIYRSRGDGFDLKAVYPPWSDKALKTALEGDPRGVSFYAVDPVEGEGFARGACHGAPKAWLALVAPKPFQPLRLVVLGDDAQAHAPVVCETLDYRWRGEWLLPPRKSDSRGQEPGVERKF